MISSIVAQSFFFIDPKTDAEVRPPISVVAKPVIALNKIVLSLNLRPMFWLSCFAYETKLSRSFADPDRVENVFILCIVVALHLHFPAPAGPDKHA